MNRIAIVCEWLTTYAGSERVLEQLLALYPNADLFAVCDFIPEHERGFLRGHRARVTFIQRLPGASKRYRSYLPLMPLAIEQIDLSAYDVVISSSHAVAKGVITGPNQVHVSYVHSPIRYAWDLQHQYLQESGLASGLKSWVARWLLHRIRIWDLRTANGVDHFVANSRFIGRRIWKVYRRESTVVYPPVDTAAFTLREDKEDFYLTASRLVPYKKIDLLVRAFSEMPTRRLVVIGDGPDMVKIRESAGPNVILMGYQPFEVLRDHMQRAKAFVFAAEEDFGIAPVEAQACGTPVIAYGKGGAMETVIGLDQAEPTGVFFPEQTVEAVTAAVETFETESHRISAVHCRANAVRFAPEQFRQQMASVVNHAWHAFQQDQ